jgi:hypothetical protein
MNSVFFHIWSSWAARPSFAATLDHFFLLLDIPKLIVSVHDRQTDRLTEVSERWTTCAMHFVLCAWVSGLPMLAPDLKAFLRAGSPSKGTHAYILHPSRGAFALLDKEKRRRLCSWEFCSLYLPFALLLREITKKHGRCLVQEIVWNSTE